MIGAIIVLSIGFIITVVSVFGTCVFKDMDGIFFILFGLLIMTGSLFAGSWKEKIEIVKPTQITMGEQWVTFYDGERVPLNREEKKYFTTNAMIKKTIVMNAFGNWNSNICDRTIIVVN